jgi:hypothetical protein
MTTVAPQLAVLPEHGEVEPVRHRAEPVPEPFAAVRVLHHLAARTRDVQHRAAFVGEADLPERGMAALLQAPLVDLDRLDPGRRGDAEGIAHVGLGDDASLVLSDRGQLPRRKAGKRPAPGSGPAKHGPAQHHLDHRAVERPRYVGLTAAGGEVERVEPGGALGGARRGVRDVHHHEAAERPQRHQQRERDAEPAVDQEGHAPRPARRPREAGKAGRGAGRGREARADARG